MSKPKSTAAKDFVLSRAHTQLNTFLSSESTRLKAALPTKDPIETQLRDIINACSEKVKDLEARINTTYQLAHEEALRVANIPDLLSGGYYRSFNPTNVLEAYRSKVADRIEEALRNHPATKAFADFELAVMCSDNQDLVTMLHDFQTRLSLLTKPQESTGALRAAEEEALRAHGSLAKRPTSKLSRR